MTTKNLSNLSYHRAISLLALFIVVGIFVLIVISMPAFEMYSALQVVGRNLNVTIFWGGLSVCLKQGYPHLPLKTFVLLFSYLCLDSIVIHLKK